jgi:hypothetical protein
METQGVKPYVRRALIDRKSGCEIIFFISFTHAIDFTRQIIDTLTKIYGMELIKNSDKDYAIDSARLICATILTNPTYVLKPQDDLLKASINETLDESKWANLDSVELKIKEKSPDFNVKSYGYSTLKDLLSAIDLFELQVTKIDDESSIIMVRCKES